LRGQYRDGQPDWVLKTLSPLIRTDFHGSTSSGLEVAVSP